MRKRSVQIEQKIAQFRKLLVVRQLVLKNRFHYDLIIDMGKTSVEKAVDLICDNVKHKVQ